MHRRILTISIALLMVCLTVWAQDDSTPDLQDELDSTVNAAVESRLTQTAEATQNYNMIQTIDAALANSLTATDLARMPTLTAQPLLTSTVINAVITQVVFPSELLFVTGGTFDMGTTPAEVLAAVQLCVEDQGGNCLIEMGDDSAPPHRVTINPFQIEVTEVTYQQYVDFLNLLGPGSHQNGCDGLPCLATNAEAESSNVFFGERYTVAPQISQFPVANVTWYGANSYCQAFNRRLPTEAEWELAARGFDGRIYPWGNEWNAEFAKTSIPETEPGSQPVSSYFSGASPSGVFHMAGNVAEWVADWYDPTFYARSPELNPTGPNSGEQKVIRGGSWDAKPFFARSVHRQSLMPTQSGAWLGFRCAADLEASVPVGVTPSVTKTATQFTNTPTLTPSPQNTPTRDPRITPSPTATPT